MLGWIFWGFIMAALLVLALILHWLAGKRQRPNRPAARWWDNALACGHPPPARARAADRNAESSHGERIMDAEDAIRDFVEGRIDLGAVLTITQVA